MTDIAIVAAVRTPVGSFRGAFAPLSAVDLGATVVRSLLERCQLPAAAVDELIFGQVLTAGCGQNPARQTALRAGLPVPALATAVAGCSLETASRRTGWPGRETASICCWSEARDTVCKDINLLRGKAILPARGNTLQILATQGTERVWISLNFWRSRSRTRPRTYIFPPACRR